MRLTVLLFIAGGGAMAEPALFEVAPNTETRWITFENPTGAKGEGGQANKGGKGAAFEPVAPGETKVLMDIEGTGTIRRMWFTLRNRDPEALRSYVIRMYWDGAEKPAVEAPFGDFFGAIHGRPVAFKSALFANMEGRSFNCFIPMPFRTAAKVTFTNESAIRLDQLFYEIDYTLTDSHSEEMCYFHAYWQRDRETELGEDFAILPAVSGSGRFLGTHIGILGPDDVLGWWGEGEVKVYLDGDDEWPTLVGTGTEDYVGTAYGQGEFFSDYSGSLIVDQEHKRYAFYRYHVPDPVYFHEDIRVTIQQMGGADKSEVERMLDQGVAIRPVSVHGPDEFFGLFDMTPYPDIAEADLPEGWTNFYRRDDVAAVAYFYLDRAASNLPRIAPVDARVAGLLDTE
ncbi:MAG: glycoside hydrolase family 172 protein [Candidatus Hydrogenedentota bacterium]